MSARGSIIGRIVTAAIFILMELAALVMLSSDGYRQSAWLTASIGGVKAVIWSFQESVRGYFMLKQRNDALAEENISLFRRLDELERVLGDKLSGAVADSLNKNKDYTFTSVKIVKMSTNKGHNYIILDKGAKDGIHRQDGIVTANGIVGMIDAVTENYSVGRTLLNRSMAVSARLGSNGIVGPLRWDGKHSDAALLSNVPLQIEYTQGDTIYSSGHSLLYPSEIPLGTAQRREVVDGVINEIRVKLFIDFAALKYVIIAHPNGRKEIEELEERGGGR